jgi:hypothetical protein
MWKEMRLIDFQWNGAHTGKVPPEKAITVRIYCPDNNLLRGSSSMVFSSRPLNSTSLQSRLKRYPALFGVPFLVIIVGASFGLQTFTQTRYDLQDQKVQQV